MNFRLDDRWYLILLVLIPLSIYLRHRRPSALRFSDVRLLELPIASSLRLRLRWLPDFFRVLWLALLVVALSRPQTPIAVSAVFSKGLALEFVLDISGSMATIEATGPGGDISRLGQLKKFVRDFLIDSSSNPHRPHDAIGLVSFARHPEVVCPLTTDHLALLDLVDGLGIDRLENRTNIGDALALAMDQFRKSQAEEQVIFLCTDGAHNVETALSTAGAASIAEALDIRIYTIGVGSPETSRDTEGLLRDEQSLRRIAQITGGRYFRAIDGSLLERIAGELDELEPSPAKVQSYRRWQDRFPEVLWAALLLWLIETILRGTWLRKRPG